MKSLLSHWLNLHRHGSKSSRTINLVFINWWIHLSLARVNSSQITTSCKCAKLGEELFERKLLEASLAKILPHPPTLALTLPTPSNYWTYLLKRLPRTRAKLPAGEIVSPRRDFPRFLPRNIHTTSTLLTVFRMRKLRGKRRTNPSLSYFSKPPQLARRGGDVLSDNYEIG